MPASMTYNLTCILGIKGSPCKCLALIAWFKGHTSIPVFGTGSQFAPFLHQFPQQRCMLSVTVIPLRQYKSVESDAHGTLGRGIGPGSWHINIRLGIPPPYSPGCCFQTQAFPFKGVWDLLTGLAAWLTAIRTRQCSVLSTHQTAVSVYRHAVTRRLSEVPPWLTMG